MSGSFDLVADAYDAWFATPVGAAADRLETDLLFQMALPRAGERALDVGTGTGHFASWLASLGLAVVGVDVSAPMLEVARAKRMNAALVRSDAACLPFRDGAFDLVLCVTALEFIRGTGRALSEMARVCRDGGRIVVGVLNAWSPWAWVRRRHARRHPADPFGAARFYAPPDLISALGPLGKARWSSSVFFLPGGAGLRQAERLECLGRVALRPFGALLVGRVDR